MYMNVMKIFLSFGITDYTIMFAILVPMALASSIIGCFAKNRLLKALGIVFGIIFFIAGLSIILHMKGINI